MVLELQYHWCGSEPNFASHGSLLLYFPTFAVLKHPVCEECHGFKHRPVLFRCTRAAVASLYIIKHNAKSSITLSLHIMKHNLNSSMGLSLHTIEHDIRCGSAKLEQAFGKRRMSVFASTP